MKKLLVEQRGVFLLLFSKGWGRGVCFLFVFWWVGVILLSFVPECLLLHFVSLEIIHICFSVKNSFSL